MTCFGCVANRNNFLFPYFPLRLSAHPKQVIVTDATGCNPQRLKVEKLVKHSLKMFIWKNEKRMAELQVVNVKRQG
jgi:hypothetical protein